MLHISWLQSQQQRFKSSIITRDFFFALLVINLAVLAILQFRNDGLLFDVVNNFIVRKSGRILFQGFLKLLLRLIIKHNRFNKTESKKESEDGGKGNVLLYEIWSSKLAERSPSQRQRLRLRRKSKDEDEVVLAASSEAEP